MAVRSCKCPEAVCLLPAIQQGGDFVAEVNNLRHGVLGKVKTV
jgi:hypothetical protein